MAHFVCFLGKVHFELAGSEQLLLQVVDFNLCSGREIEKKRREKER